jgi:hypothetical protein
MGLADDILQSHGLYRCTVNKSMLMFTRFSLAMMQLRISRCRHIYFNLKNQGSQSMVTMTTVVNAALNSCTPLSPFHPPLLLPRGGRAFQ